MFYNQIQKKILFYLSQSQKFLVFVSKILNFKLL